MTGDRTIEYDKFHKHIGLKRAAQAMIDTLRSYPEELAIMEAYRDGVNAYVSSLKPKDYPIEFKLLNYKPEKWTLLKSALIVKTMAWDLNGDPDDGPMTNTRNAFTDSLFTELYPFQEPYYEPIIPEAVKPVRRRSRGRTIRYPTNYITSKVFPVENLGPDYTKGSNNWVVGGEKTRSGAPILANDPHLGLNLPSIWYELQLANENVNVYGVSLPGIPMVVIGFNDKVSWGLTNAQSDFIDFYRIDLSRNKMTYTVDGKTFPTEILLDTLAVKGKADIIDTVYNTKYGPIIFTEPKPLNSYNWMVPDKNTAMKWTAHDPSLEMVTFSKLNRAQNYSDYKEALSYYSAPSQNFVFAAQTGDIAIWHNGKFPKRQDEQGRFVLDASLTNNWTEYIPKDELPNSVNPQQGFLMSANQPPVKGDYPYYLGRDGYVDFERANRIQEVLDSLKEITPYDMQRLQLDSKSILAEKILPTMLALVDQESLSDEASDLYNEINSWNYEFSEDSNAPVIFQNWIEKLRRSMYRDEADTTNYWKYPSDEITLKLITVDTLSLVFDNKRTEETETRAELVNESFKSTSKLLISEFGGLSDSWSYGDVKPVTIGHLGDIAGFSRSSIRTNGSKRSVNAVGSDHGPSWRMVVEMGESPIGYGIYPGGQSGHPGSAHYDAYINDWAAGQYYELHYLSSAEKKGSVKQVTKLSSND